MPRHKLSDLPRATAAILDKNPDINLVAMTPKVRADVDYVLLFAGNFAEVALSAKLTGRDYEVVMAYLSAMAFGNLLEMPQSAIAERLGMTKQAVSRTVRRLESVGILIRDHHGALRFNMNLVMRGRMAEVLSRYLDFFRESMATSVKCGHNITPIVGMTDGLRALCDDEEDRADRARADDLRYERRRRGSV